MIAEQSEDARLPLQVDFSLIELTEVIGVGGFGKVYRGVLEDREVAVKVARQDLAEDLEKNTRKCARRGTIVLYIIASKHH